MIYYLAVIASILFTIFIILLVRNNKLDESFKFNIERLSFAYFPK